MCGIVGVITKKDDTRAYTKEKFITEGLYVDALRGFHSTGYMGLSKDFQWEWQKQACSAARFISHADWQKRKFDRWCMVGHNRHATIGEVTTDNAHPFKHGPVLLVHNGTLRQTYDLPVRDPKIEVDSELICLNLAEAEVEDAPKIISKLSGAYALVWFDERDESVNMVRNAERPLHLGINKQEDILYLMSDGWMMKMLTERIQDQTSQPRHIWQIATRQILKFKKGSLVPEVTAVPNFTPAGRGPRPSTPQKRGDTGKTVVIRKRGDTRTRSTLVGLTGSLGDPRFIGINGEHRSIPGAHLGMLTDWYNLTPTDSLCFRQSEYLYWGKSKAAWGETVEGCMYGQIYHPVWEVWLNARVIFINPGNGARFGAEEGHGPWTVHPIGVDHTDFDGNKRNQLTFICRVKYYNWQGDVPSDGEDDKTQEVKGPPIEIEEETDEYEDLYEDVVKGPRGHYVNIEAWDELTKHGCVMCTGPVMIEDAEEMVWVGEMENQPLCMPCLREATEITK